MRILFEMGGGPAHGILYARPSARCIALDGTRVAMVHSRKYNYYKFPGGGIEPGETAAEAMIREAREEAGLLVIPHSVREYGCVHRIEKSDRPGVDFFVQDNFYYLCRTEAHLAPQCLDNYEAEEGFTLEWVDPDQAIVVNRFADHGPKNQNMLEREARVLVLLKEEGYFSRDTI